MTSTQLQQASFAEMIESRFSCRAFLPEPVDAATLTEVFRRAQQTASWCNSQAWKVELTGPETTRRLSESLLENVRTQGPGGTDIPVPASYEDEYLQRRRASGFALYGALGIGREDKQARTAQALLNYTFFGAPHVAIVHSPALLGPYGYVDCGGYVANVLNAAQSLGLATIAQAAVVLRPTAVRAVLDIPEDRHLVCGIAIGYPDLDHPVNAFRTERAQLDDVVAVYP